MKKNDFLLAALLCCSFSLFAQKAMDINSSQHITTVFDYEYAPGQHALNYAAGADGSAFVGNTSSYVLLGGWGGHIDAGFDHSVYNIGGYDFGVYSQPGSGDEPGVVYVMQDANGNGEPDDVWYELKGSVVDSAGYMRGYERTYYKAGTDANATSYVTWSDNQGETGSLSYAKWWDDTKDSVTFKGTLLPDNKENTTGPYWYDIDGLYTYGYAEVYSADDYNSSNKYNQFDISNAIDMNGDAVKLDYIDFIKVQTGVAFEAGWLGEVSTETKGAIDLTMQSYAPATFEDIELTEESALEPEANVEIGETDTSLVISGNFMFKGYGTNWGYGYTSWYGAGVSNQTDNISDGSYMNEFNSTAGGDITGEGNYAVIYDSYSVPYDGGQPVTASIIGHPAGEMVSGLYITNNTYALTSMQNGDSFAKKFGGDDGTDPDYLRVLARGINADGETTETATFYLADFRSDNSEEDYIVTEWKWFDLSSLGEVVSIEFTMESSDAGDYGINTPLYYCVDNINYSGFETANPLADISVNVGAEDASIDLSNLFSYEYGEVSLSLIANDAEEVITSSIESNALSIAYSNQIGVDTLVIKGTTTSGIIAYDTVTVAICAVPTMNQSLADITVDEDAPYDTINIKNFFSYSADAFVSISTKETQLSGENIVDPYVYGDSILVLKYEENMFGQSKISLTCIANSDTLTDTLLLTINSVQDTVYVKSPLADLSKNEDYSNNDYSVYISSVFADDDGDEIAKTITCINGVEFMTATIREGGKYIDFVYDKDSTGTATFELKGTTPDGLFAVDTFSFTLKPVDDSPVVANAIDDVYGITGNETTIDLSAAFTDVDNDDAAITKVISSNSDESVVSAAISGDELSLTFLTLGEAEIEIEATSNGETVSDVFVVSVSYPTQFADATLEQVELYPNPSNGVFRVNTNNSEAVALHIYTLSGSLVYTNPSYSSSQVIDISDKPSGQYMIQMNKGDFTYRQTIIVQ